MGFGDSLRCEKGYSNYCEEDCAHIFPQGELQGNIKPEQRKGWCDLRNGGFSIYSRRSARSGGLRELNQVRCWEKRVAADPLQA